MTDQRNLYPIGTMVRLKKDTDLQPGAIAYAGTIGRVVECRSDGTVVFSFGEWGEHIFKYDVTDIIEIDDIDE